MLLSSSTASQITSGGRAFQAKNATFTIKKVVEQAIGRTSDNGGAAGLFPLIRGAYVHIPFCFHKCHYCDFYSIVDSRDRQDEFARRLIMELDAASEFVNQPLETIFVGGGTPTLLAPGLWEKLLETINQRLIKSSKRVDRCEFTVEANPETVTSELAWVLVRGGVNRVSIGCQSFNPRHLKTLERWHDPQNVHRSVEIFRDAGINNLNLDLIFAIPGQTLDEWLADLDEALSLEPAHLSCYGLMYESNTPLTVKMKAGHIQPVDQDLEAVMYEATIDRLTQAGFEHYEISNWAKRTPSPSRERAGVRVECADQMMSSACSMGQTKVSARCRHNMLYWTNANWWPFGPSASGHFDGLRWKNVARLGEYLEHGPFPPIGDVERLDEDGRIGEAFMLGLRLIDGIELQRVEELISKGLHGPQRQAALDRHIDGGFLESSAGRLRLSRRGLLVADTVLADLI